MSGMTYGCAAVKEIPMSSSAALLSAPEGPGSVSGEPNLLRTDCEKVLPSVEHRQRR